MSDNADRFKFRFWDKISESFLDLVHVYFHHETGSIAYEDCWATKDIVMMQSTGLCDSKNNLIFEGDIVNHDLGGHDTFLIRFDQERAGFIVETIHHKKGYDFIETLWYENEYEVIGNIYENPELLEEKK